MNAILFVTKLSLEEASEVTKGSGRNQKGFGGVVESDYRRNGRALGISMITVSVNVIKREI